ncbi:hypothetical protein AB0958_21845 [Streptomyces sp. NPDC006655]|uniref:C1q-like domain-containing protein n=1 Tax=Streptomyces sp. NPDC006655 TaxID=3156898 RepID=UPI003451BB6E
MATTGGILSASLWNSTVYNGLNFLLSPVAFKGYSTVSQNLASSTTSTVLNLDTELIDTDGAHSTTTNTSRFTCQTAGWYYITGSVCFATNSSGTRTLNIFLNGAGVVGAANQVAPSASNGTSVLSSTFVQLNVGDYVELAAWQNSGSSLGTSTSTAIATTMCVYRVSN